MLYATMLDDVHPTCCVRLNRPLYRATKRCTVTASLQKVATTQKSTMQVDSDESDLPTGWALRKPKTGGVRFPTKVRQYLVAKFDYGQKTGRKCDPAQSATDVRKAKNQSGDSLLNITILVD